MENYGLITYREERSIIDERNTPYNQKITSVLTIAHEMGTDENMFLVIYLQALYSFSTLLFISTSIFWKFGDAGVLVGNLAVGRSGKLIRVLHCCFNKP